MPRARLTTGARTRIVVNRNRLVARVPSIDGVKTGHTQRAGYVLVGAATRKGARLVSVVLGEPSEAARDADTLALLRYGFTLYRRAPGRARRAPRSRGRRSSTSATARRRSSPRGRVSVTVRRGERVRTVVDAPGELERPASRRERGSAPCAVYRGERLVRTVPLVTARGGARRRVCCARASGFVVPLVMVAAGVGIWLAVRRRRRRRRRGAPAGRADVSRVDGLRLAARCARRACIGTAL